MSTEPKSLAAEIEAVLRDLAQSLKGQILALPLQPEGERNV